MNDATPPVPPPRRSPQPDYPAGRVLDAEPHTGSFPVTREYGRHLRLFTVLWSIGGSILAVGGATLGLYKWTVGEMRQVVQSERAERAQAELQEARRAGFIPGRWVRRDGGVE